MSQEAQGWALERKKGGIYRKEGNVPEKEKGRTKGTNERGKKKRGGKRRNVLQWGRKPTGSRF